MRFLKRGEQGESDCTLYISVTTLLTLFHVSLSCVLCTCLHEALSQTQSLRKQFKFDLHGHIQGLILVYSDYEAGKNIHV